MGNTTLTPRERAALAEEREAEAQRKKRAASGSTVPKAAQPVKQSAPANRPAQRGNTNEYPRVRADNTQKKPPVRQAAPVEKEDTGEFPSYVRRGKGGYHPPKVKSRKMPRHRKKLNPKITAAISAISAIILIIIILLLIGVRYKTVDAGASEITFFGIVKNGEAQSGWLSYSGGERGRLTDASKIKFSDGSIYEGEIRDVIRDGNGVMTFANGDIYEGEFDDDQISGNGKITYKNGDVYEGGFKNGLRSGKGTVTYADGTIFEGEFAGGRKNGYGVYTGNGTSYEGNYVDDIKEGRGKQVFSNGDSYEGEYKNDMRNGRGIYTWSDGGYYDGEFKDNIQHGEGKRVFASGITQEGNFQNGLFVG